MMFMQSRRFSHHFFLLPTFYFFFFFIFFLISNGVHEGMASRCKEIPRLVGGMSDVYDVQISI